MTEYEKRINRAMNAQKKKYGHECIFSGHHEETIVGAHIFKRSTHPELAAFEENIVPLSEHNDILLEKINDPWKRICIILDKVHMSIEEKVSLQMKILIQEVLYREDIKGLIS